MSDGFRIVSAKRLLCGAVVATMACAAQSARAVTYSYTDVGALIGGSEVSSYGTSLNSVDQIGGYYYTTSGSGQPALPFVYTPGTGGSAGTAMTVPGVGQGYTSMVDGINNAGLAVGVDGNSQNAFTYNINTQTFTSVPKGGNYSIVLNGINSSGMASGYIEGTAATYYDEAGFVYNTATGTSTNVSQGFAGPTYINGHQTPTFSINDSGQLAGSGVNQSNTLGPVVPFVATPNGTGGFTYKDLSASIEAADPSFSRAGGGQYIDALGDVAGSYNQAGSSGSGYLYTAATGTTTVLTASGAYYDYTVDGVADVDGVSEVVGSREITVGFTPQPVAFAYISGVATDISGVVPGYVLTVADAVNSKGDIVATGTPIGGGAAQAFLITVPEPTSLTALIAGPLLLMRRRRLA
jgi:hypothetical protein